MEELHYKQRLKSTAKHAPDCVVNSLLLTLLIVSSYVAMMNTVKTGDCFDNHCGTTRLRMAEGD